MEENEIEDAPLILPEEGVDASLPTTKTSAYDVARVMEIIDRQAMRAIGTAKITLNDVTALRRYLAMCSLEAETLPSGPRRKGAWKKIETLNKIITELRRDIVSTQQERREDIKLAQGDKIQDLEKTVENLSKQIGRLGKKQ